jgi:hypothetical protein
MLYPSELQPRDFRILVYPRKSGFSRRSICNSLTRFLFPRNMYFHDIWRLFGGLNYPPLVILLRRNAGEGPRPVFFRKPEIGWTIPEC